MHGLKGRVAIVTGGGSGIGEAICARLAEAGACISIFDKNIDGAVNVAKRIEGAGVRAHVEQVDISSYSGVKSAVARAEAAMGPAEILINCAGWDKMVRFLDTDEALHDEIIAINMKGPINMMHCVLPGMAERNYGRVVSISSDAGRAGGPGQAVYSACKAGIIGISRTLAREHARNTITFNCVAPGPTKTPLMENALGGGHSEKAVKDLERMEKAVPLRRFGLPEDVAGITAFLASDEASYITGQVISVSGGLTMQG